MLVFGANTNSAIACGRNVSRTLNIMWSSASKYIEVLDKSRLRKNHIPVEQQ